MSMTTAMRPFTCSARCWHDGVVITTWSWNFWPGLNVNVFKTCQQFKVIDGQVQ